MKSDSLSSNMGHEAVSDASALSFEPPIGEFIAYKVSSCALCLMACNFIHNFMILTWISLLCKQDYRSDHHVLALAMKQVLLQEVCNVVTW